MVSKFWLPFWGKNVILISYLLLLNQLIILKILPATIFKELFAAYRKLPVTVPKAACDSENCSGSTDFYLIGLPS
jgi:hypothetical protein